MNISTISLEVELSNENYYALKTLLEQNPQWDQNVVIEYALEQLLTRFLGRAA